MACWAIRRLRCAAVLGMVLAFLLPVWPGGPALAHCTRARQARSSETVRIVLDLINHDRAAAELPALRLGWRLSRAARSHSLDMAHRAYFAHRTPEGVSPDGRLVRAGVRCRQVGENLGYASGDTLPAMLHAINRAMLHSPEHRANLLRRSFTRVGLGVVVTGDQVYVTEDFAG